MSLAILTHKTMILIWSICLFIYLTSFKCLGIALATDHMQHNYPIYLLFIFFIHFQECLALKIAKADIIQNPMCLNTRP
jgi:hypothetical protein